MTKEIDFISSNN